MPTAIRTGAGREARDVQRLAVLRRVTLVGAWADLLLGLAKLLGGWLAGSHALIADGLHSLSDLATDVLVLAAAKAAHAGADEDHPYGHARIETAATVGLGLALVAVAAGVVIDSGYRLWQGESAGVPQAWALWVAAASVTVKEALYHYTIHFARKTGSSLLQANAWHSRSDAASSLIVIVGVAASLAGWPNLDIVAALLVGVLIGRIGYRLCKDGLRELIDTGLDGEQLELIRSAIVDVDGVKDLHELRTRSMGGRALVDVHIMLEDPRISVSEGHQISETVRARLIRRIEKVEDVMVHIDPEDDERYPASQDLALRSEVMGRLSERWRHLPAAAYLDRVDLHYLGGRLQVVLFIPVTAEAALGASALDIKLAFQSVLAEEPDVGQVDLLIKV